MIMFYFFSHGKLFDPMELKCDDAVSWKYGLSVINAMSTVSHNFNTKITKLLDFSLIYLLSSVID